MNVSVEIWLAFTFACAILAIIPGPTVMLVMGYALADGRRSAGAVVVGVSLANIVAVGVSLAGLGAVLSASALAFTLLKWLGAGYLIYLGIGMWFTKSKPPEPGQSGQRHLPTVAKMRHAFFATVFFAGE